MKNIVKVMRLKDNANRLYALPEGVTVKKGTLVIVEFPDRFSTCLGTAVSDSYEVDEATAAMIADLHHIGSGTLDHLKRVISVCTETPCEWDDLLGDDDAADGVGQTFSPDADDAEEA